MADRIFHRSNCRGKNSYQKFIKTCQKVLTFVSRFLCISMQKSCQWQVFCILPSSFPFCRGNEMGGFLKSRGKIHKPPQEVVLMTEEQKNVVIKRRNSGFGYASIAKEAGLAMEAVVAFCRRNRPFPAWI